MEDYKRELDNYFCRFTFGQFVTLILIEIVTLFFVFYLGAHYGPELMGTKDAIAKKGDSDLPGDNPKNVDDLVGKPSVEYTYPEILTQKEGSKAIKVKPSGLTAEEYEKKDRETDVVAKEIPVEVPPIREIKKEKKEVPKPGTPEAMEKEAEALQTTQVTQVASVTKKGKFAVQVGSYPNPEEANAVLGRWKKKGYSAFVQTGEIPEKGTWYRVRIGRYSTKQEAQDFLEKLKKREKIAGIVVSQDS